MNFKGTHDVLLQQRILHSLEGRINTYVYYRISCIESESPAAVAGINRIINAKFQSKVTLNRETSYDPSGDITTYHWTIKKTPEGSEVQLSAYDKMEVEASLDKLGEYTFGLVVTDGNSSSAKDKIIIRYLPDGSLTTVDKGDRFFEVFKHPTIACGRQCDDCHENYENEFHIPLDAKNPISCQACHYPNVWLPLEQINHQYITGLCADCHEVSDSHIETNEDCAICHMTSSWVKIIDLDQENSGGSGQLPFFDHINIIDNCDVCHAENETTQSKNINHILSTMQCLP